MPGLAGTNVIAAVEDVRAVHMSCDITEKVQQSIDQMDDVIEDQINTCPSEYTSEFMSMFDSGNDDMSPVDNSNQMV